MKRIFASIVLAFSLLTSAFAISNDQYIVLFSSNQAWCKASWCLAPKYQGAAAIANFRQNQYALPTLGPELVVNGTFDSGTGWTATGGWTISGGAANFDNVTAGHLTSTSVVPVPGKTYLVVFTEAGGNPQTNLVRNFGGTIVGINGPATISVYITATTSAGLDFYSAGPYWTAPGTIDNVSVREVKLGEYGAEMVVAANWQMSVSGGTATATNSPAGTLNLTGDGSNNAIGDQSFTTVTGQAYTLIFTVGTSSGNLSIGPTQGSGSIIGGAAFASGSTYIQTFTATSTTTWARFYKTVAATSVVSAISLRPFTPAVQLRSATFAEFFAYTAASTTARTYVNSAGLIANNLAADQPRFDYTNGYQQLALNDAATNLARYSQDYANAAWSKSSGNVTVNNAATTAPDGTQTGNLITFATTAQYIYQDIGSAGTSETGTYSFYVKKSVGAQWVAQILFYFGGTQVTVAANFNLDTLAVTNCTLIPLSNGWYRVVITGTNNGTGNTIRELNLLGGAANSSIYAWGSQYELSSFASPYIPTAATAVARAIETARLSPLLEAILQRSAASVTVRGQNVQPNSGRILGNTATSWGIYRAANNALWYTGTVNFGAAFGSGTFAGAWGGAYAKATGDRAICVNSGSVATSATTEDGFSGYYLSRDSSGSDYLSGWYDELVIRPYRMPAASLQADARPY